MTAPKPMKRRAIRKGELRTVAARCVPDFDAATLDALSRAGLKDAIRLHGSCEGCDAPFAGATPDYDHRVPNAILFEGDAIDWQALCKPCHAVKTKQDVKTAAKTKRLSGETGQRARRERRDRPLIQSRTEIQSRGFQKSPQGYSAWKRSAARVKDVNA